MTAVAAAITLSACSSADDSASAPASSTSTRATTSAAASSTSNANAPLAPGSEITVGSEKDAAISARIVVHSVTQEAAPNAPRPVSGGHWAAIDVQTCVDKSNVPFTVGWDTWTLADANYGNYPASNLTYNQFPKPLYPFGSQTVAVGDCVRGSILFPIPDGVTITRVKYNPNPKLSATWSAT
ncbi:hypothetical protein [Nocardia wallacei]|uniref:hypothetical protein n=1 Tax=Nocardia wallacei TaxID=480035 RepID=UPI002454AE0F|nr:hypothetical protein [Nocardia wallacei]